MGSTLLVNESYLIVVLLDALLRILGQNFDSHFLSIF